MRVIALFGRGNTGKTRCLGHLTNLMHRESQGFDFLIEGQDVRVSFDFLGQRIAVCTGGDNYDEMQKNLDFIRQYNPDIAIVATRTKGYTVKIVEQFCEQNHIEPRWVEKYVANPDDGTEQEYMNHLQAKQILDYIRSVIEGLLYYVDSIVENEGDKYHVTLLGVEIPNEGFPRSLTIPLNRDQIYYLGKERRIQEDDFVLYHPDSGNLLRYANDNPRAEELRNESIGLRQDLVERVLPREAAWAINQEVPKGVKSFHVNVGHGNCSLILVKYESGYDLWMVDCSTFDHLIRCDYNLDLYWCLKDIAGELNLDLQNLHISRFMLTHTHFDHYNGMLYLMKQGVIDSTTLMYVNLHYDCASPVWSAIMKGLKGIKCKFVEPISDNLMHGAIKIYHPECRIYRNSNSVPAEKKIQYRIVPKANDASVVYGINLLGKVMVLPGDLEKKGFKEMSGHEPCRGNLVDTVYYLVSHHGSQNGHPDVMCMSKGGPNPKPLCCVSQNVKKVILMGRNGAYPGIYSQTVIDYWENTLGGLEYTERTPHYLELNWMDDKVAMV